MLNKKKIIKKNGLLQSAEYSSVKSDSPFFLTKQKNYKMRAIDLHQLPAVFYDAVFKLQLSEKAFVISSYYRILLFPDIWPVSFRV
ncbi:MAG: hypothetical protein K5761_00790, partial [Clostridiales bacterium]|nr:hypothetical protein [Clostridiales bacterium]